MKRFLSAALAAATAIAAAGDAASDPTAAIEDGLRAAILAKVDEANPADPATGARASSPTSTSAGASPGTTPRRIP